MDNKTKLIYLIQENTLYIQVIETITAYLKFERDQFTTLFHQPPTESEIVNQTISEMYIGNQIIKETLLEICKRRDSVEANKQLELIFDKEETQSAQPTDSKD